MMATSCNNINNGHQSGRAIQRICTKRILQPLLSFRFVTSSTFPVEHLYSGILQALVKRHAPPIARIIEPLQILLAQFLDRSVVLLF